MTKWIVALLVVCIVVAHVFLWRSDMPFHLKIIFTVINATGWTIVLAPIFLVDRWLKSIETKNADAAKHRDVT